MCTVSWFFRDGNLSIAMNRDEQNSRAPARPPVVVQAGDCNALMPIDTDHGGSWIAVNNAGFVFCLLNYYAATTQSRPWRSRGLLLRTLASCKSWELVDLELQSSRLKDYRPFMALIFHRNAGPILYLWDQAALKVQAQVCSPVSSSSWLPRLVPIIRHRWVRRAQKKIKTLAELEQLHLRRPPFIAAAAVNMKRASASTVSLTTVTLNDERAVMSYRSLVEPKEPVSTTLTMTTQAKKPFISKGKLIDIQAIFTRYHPDLAARISKVQWSLLRWLLCEKKLNQIIESANGLSESQFYDSVMDRLRLVPSLHYWRMPEVTEAPVFVSNHPTGGVDGLIALSWLTKRYPDLLVIANDALEIIPGMSERLVQVNVFGAPEKSAGNVQNAFKSERPILIYAAGKTARYHQGQLDDGDWSGSIATLARRYNRLLVPMHIESHNSFLFYSIHRLRQLLNIKSNYEMLLLPRELLRPCVRKPAIYFDLPVRVHELAANGQSDFARALWLKQRSYALPRHFRETKHANQSNSCSS